MNTKLKAVLLSLLVASPAWAERLVVAPGATYTIQPAQQTLTLDELVLGDGAQITFAAGVSHWSVQAAHASIGERVLIAAQGAAGESGGAGAQELGMPANCEEGRDGGAGITGTDGRSGVNLELRLKLVSLGSLKIDTSGGSGGNGGQGGQGQPGGESNGRCMPARGGDAGAGGDGGRGGDAGNIVLLYELAGSALDATQVNRAIELVALGGNAGQGGKAGEPGNGAPGRYVRKRSLTGDKEWVPEGRRGRAAADGQRGFSGRDGQVVLQQGLERAPVSLTPVSTTPSAQEAQERTIEQLKQQLRLMQERLDALDQP